MEKLSNQRFETWLAENAPNTVSRAQATITARRWRTMKCARVASLGGLSGVVVRLKVLDSMKLLSSASVPRRAFTRLDGGTFPNSSAAHDPSQAARPRLLESC